MMPGYHRVYSDINTNPMGYALIVLVIFLTMVFFYFSKGLLGSFAGTFLDPRNNPTALLVISYAVRRLPYMVRAAYAGFQQTSVTLEEASQNLGASPLRTLYKITFQLVMANLVAGGILSFSFAMLEVSDSLILAMTERFYPITKAIYDLSKTWRCTLYR